MMGLLTYGSAYEWNFPCVQFVIFLPQLECCKCMSSPGTKMGSFCQRYTRRP